MLIKYVFSELLRNEDDEFFPTIQDGPLLVINGVITPINVSING